MRCIIQKNETASVQEIAESPTTKFREWQPQDIKMLLDFPDVHARNTFVFSSYIGAIIIALASAVLKI
jgi:hypothetical protein